MRNIKHNISTRETFSGWEVIYQEGKETFVIDEFLAKSEAELLAVRVLIVVQKLMTATVEDLLQEFRDANN